MTSRFSFPSNQVQMVVSTGYHLWTEATIPASPYSIHKKCYGALPWARYWRLSDKRSSINQAQPSKLLMNCPRVKYKTHTAYSTSTQVRCHIMIDDLAQTSTESLQRNQRSLHDTASVDSTTPRATRKVRTSDSPRRFPGYANRISPDLPCEDYCPQGCVRLL